MELKVTKERVLSAASRCSTAKATLKELFPEAFEPEWVDVTHECTYRLDTGMSGGYYIEVDFNGNWLAAITPYGMSVLPGKREEFRIKEGPNLRVGPKSFRIMQKK